MFQIRTTKRFEKEFKKLDYYTQKMILSWMKKNLSNCMNPRLLGKELKGNLEGLWRFQIGDYRLICVIQDDECIILTLAVGHRKEIFDKL